MSLAVAQEVQAQYSLVSSSQSATQVALGQSVEFNATINSSSNRYPRTVVFQIRKGTTTVASESFGQVYFYANSPNGFRWKHPFQLASATGSHTLRILVKNGSTTEATLDNVAQLEVVAAPTPTPEPTPEPPPTQEPPPPTTSDPCLNNPVRGTVCKDGAVYAGVFNNKRYMITASGCNGVSCSGGTDNTQRIWAGDMYGINIDVDIPNVTSSSDGASNTSIIASHPSNGPYSAAKYCQDMVHGGYSDWYLPNRAEMAYLYCHTKGVYRMSNYPFIDPACKRSGKSSTFEGFVYGVYLTSSEFDSRYVGYISMSGARGEQISKGQRGSIRCVRKY